jgi:hypothetical protein
MKKLSCKPRSFDTFPTHIKRANECPHKLDMSTPSKAECKRRSTLKQPLIKIPKDLERINK